MKCWGGKVGWVVSRWENSIWREPQERGELHSYTLQVAELAGASVSLHTLSPIFRRQLPRMGPRGRGSCQSGLQGADVEDSPTDHMLGSNAWHPKLQTRDFTRDLINELRRRQFNEFCEQPV